MINRKLCALTAVAVSSLLLTACGSKEYLKDIKAEKYVTLGDYMGLEATVARLEVSEDVVEKFIEENYLSPKADITPVTGRPVQDGDVANIDFTGYLDGTAFDGGAGTDFDLTIGSGQFIDGFEDGLIGVNEGETVSLDLTFPDPYTGNPDLSGAAVVFEVTVNQISERKLPTLTDELVQELSAEGYNVGTCQTATELKDWIYGQYEQSVQSAYDSQLETALASALMENSTFKELPEALVARYTKSIENSVSARAASAGMTLAQYMQISQGLDEAGYQAAFAENGERMARQYVMYQAVADKEGLAPTEEEIDRETAALMLNYGYASEEDLEKSIDMESLKEDLMRKKVVAFLIANGNIQETAVSAE